VTGLAEISPFGRIFMEKIAQMIWGAFLKKIFQNSTT
jgi:hypothetical protein